MTWAIEEKCYSQRRACGLVGLDPKTCRYASRRPDDAAVRARLRELALERRRFGYRRLHILLRREGLELNHKKLFRLYREERLTVKKRGGRKRALGTRAPMAVPQGLNQRWSLDFVSDRLADGRRFRVLVVVDDFTRECLALVVDTSLSGMRVTRAVALRQIAPGCAGSQNVENAVDHAPVVHPRHAPRLVREKRGRWPPIPCRSDRVVPSSGPPWSGELESRQRRAGIPLMSSRPRQSQADFAQNITRRRHRPALTLPLFADHTDLQVSERRRTE